MTAVLDDEMEAMLREIEAMGMEPDAPAAPVAEEKPAIVPEARAAGEPVISTEPKPSVVEKAKAVVKKVEKAAPAGDVAELEAALADLEGDKTVEEAVAATAATAAIAEPAERPADPAPEPKPNPKTAVEVAAAAAARERRAPAYDLLDPDQVKRDISINPTDLDTALIEHPGLELHYAMKTADARRAYERLKSGVEVLEAQLDAKYREELSEGASKKPTEAAIRNALVADAKYASAQSKLIDAQHLWKLCEATENSFRSRKDILLEVARDRRKEKEGAMRVLDDESLRRRVAGITGVKAA